MKPRGRPAVTTFSLAPNWPNFGVFEALFSLSRDTYLMEADQGPLPYRYHIRHDILRVPHCNNVFIGQGRRCHKRGIISRS